MTDSLAHFWSVIRDVWDLPITREDAIKRMQDIKVVLPERCQLRSSDSDGFSSAVLVEKPQQLWSWPAPQHLSTYYRKMLYYDAMRELRAITRNRRVSTN